MDEDDVVYWQDVLDDVAAGKTQGLRCPFCAANGKNAEIAVSKPPEAPLLTRVECKVCRRFIEGRLQGD